MKKNGGIIGPQIRPAQVSATGYAPISISGVFDSFQAYNHSRQATWPQTIRANWTSVTPSAPSEGTPFTTKINLSGAPAGLTLHYSIVGLTGTVNASDFTDGSLTGTFTTYSEWGTTSSGQFSKTCTVDNTIETGESFAIEIRLGNNLGPLLATTSAITPGDTSDSLISGNPFTSYIPVAADSYTLFNALGSGSTGNTAMQIDSGFVKINVNGQGRGVMGTGASGAPSSTVFQLLYAPSGGSAYNYTTYYDDPFQPGTPHEAGFFYIDSGAATLGGFNDATLTNPQNGTTRIWKPSNDTIVVLVGTTTYGHAVMQYKILASSPRIVRIQMAYTNTTTSSHAVLAQRGGDCDFGDYATANGRGYGSYSASDYVYSSSASSTVVPGKTLGIFCPGNGYTHNSVISTSFTSSNPTACLNGTTNSNGTQDTSIYCAWNFGTVAPGQTVWANCYYLLGTSASDAASLIY